MAPADAIGRRAKWVAPVGGGAFGTREEKPHVSSHGANVSCKSNDVGSGGGGCGLAPGEDDGSFASSPAVGVEDGLAVGLGEVLAEAEEAEGVAEHEDVAGDVEDAAKKTAAAPPSPRLPVAARVRPTRAMRIEAAMFCL
jgi:hypothetical protein